MPPKSPAPSQASLTLREIVDRLGGEVAGDDALAISGVATLEAAGAAEITFLANPRYRSKLASTRAGAVILAPRDRDATAIARIVADNPYAYFARTLALFHPPRAAVAGVHAAAVVDPSALVAPFRRDRARRGHRARCARGRAGDHRGGNRPRRGCRDRRGFAAARARHRGPRLRGRRALHPALRRGHRRRRLRHGARRRPLDQDPAGRAARSSATTSRSGPIPRSTAAPWATPSSRKASRSTTRCRSPTIAASVRTP